MVRESPASSTPPTAAATNTGPTNPSLVSVHSAASKEGGFGVSASLGVSLFPSLCLSGLVSAGLGASLCCCSFEHPTYSEEQTS